jgi:uncharacterized membrane protein YecN with MAPEG domain
MTVRGFIFLLAVVMVAIAVGDQLAQRWSAPGFERTFTVFVVAALIVAPAAWVAERLGWIRGRFTIGGGSQDSDGSRG